MKAESLKHASFLIVSIFTIWFWSATPSLSIYNLQLTGVFVLLYFVSKMFSRPTNHKGFDIASTVILNSICLLLIFSTGGVTSPLFFLLDFLLITLALLFEPAQAVVASVLLSSLFFWDNHHNLTTEKIINIISPLLMTPVAIIFSKNYLEILKSRGRIQVLEETIKEEETESLLWISTQAKPSLASVLNATTDLVMYFNSKGRDLLLPRGLVEKLKAIQNDLVVLYSSTTSLQESIEEKSDKIKLQQEESV